MAAGIFIIARVLTRLGTEQPVGSTIAEILATVAGILLIAGLWTPVSGSLVAVFALWSAISRPGNPWTSILLGTIGAALTLLGPGAYSIDARLFGWKRIDVHDRET
jgi:putative oxidoreductase